MNSAAAAIPLVPVLRLGAARGLARLEAVIAILEPVNGDRGRQRIASTSARLPSESRAPCRIKVGVRSDAKCAVRSFSGRPGGWEGIAETQQARDAHLVGDHAGDAAAKRLAADHQAPGAQRHGHRQPCLAQHARRIRPPAPALAPPRHVGKLETRDSVAARRQTLGERRHEGAVHRAPAPCASATVRAAPFGPSNRNSVIRPLTRHDGARRRSRLRRLACRRRTAASYRGQGRMG